MRYTHYEQFNYITSFRQLILRDIHWPFLQSVYLVSRHHVYFLSMYIESMQQTNLFCAIFFPSCLTTCHYYFCRVLIHDMGIWCRREENREDFISWKASDNVNNIKLRLIAMSFLIVPLWIENVVKSNKTDLLAKNIVQQ